MKENEVELKPGSVVQLSPTISNPAFAGCYMTITEPKAFGAQGYIQAIGDRVARGGQAYYRAKWEEMEFVGNSTWYIE